MWRRGGDGTVLLWDLQQGKAVRTFTGHTREVFCLAFSPDGRQMLSAGQDRDLRLWEVATGGEVHRLTGHTDSVNQVAFTPDGTRALSAGSDFTVRLWDLRAGKELRQFPGHKDIVWAVALSPDGRQAASAGGTQRNASGTGFVPGARDHDIRLWDVESGKELKRFVGHPEAVGVLAFSPDGRRLLSAGNDGAVVLWQIDSGRELRRFPGHKGLVRALAFFPDGRHAVSAGDDQALRVWALPAEVPDLVKDLRSPDPTTRLEAVLELGRFGPAARGAAPALLEAASRGDRAFRSRVVQVLRKLGPLGRDHLAALGPLLRDKEFADGQHFALESLDGATLLAAPGVLKALTEGEAPVRRRAARVLGVLGRDVRKEALKPLVDALRCASRRVWCW